MTRAICFMFVLFILIWIFQWSSTSRKVEEIKQSSEHIEKMLDEVSNDLGATLEAIRKRMDDEESWQQVEKSLRKNNVP